jgi:hypothetical protein
VDGDAGLEESSSVGGFYLCFCCTVMALPWVDGGGYICGDGGNSTGD